MNQRDRYVDVAKGLCMLLIICIHTEVFEIIGMPLTFIAVPMFFFMSGFYDRSEKPFTQYVIKSAKTLLYPAFVWCVIGALYLSLLTYLKSREVNFIFDICSPCHYDGPAWFLLSLFFTKVIIWGVIRTKLSQFLLLPICFGIGYLGSMYQMPLNIDEALAAVPLYYCGKLLYPKLKDMINNNWIALFGFIILLLFIFTPYYYNIGPSNPLFRPYYLLAIGGAFLVFFMILYVSSLLSNVKCLQVYGEKTLGIMLIHSLMCHTAAVVLNRVFDKGSTLWIICFLIAYALIVVLSYYITAIIEKKCPILLGQK